MSNLFAAATKLGSLAVSALGVNTHNVTEMSIGSAVAVAVHLIDSIWNSPKGEKPSVISALSAALNTLKG